MTGHIEPVFRLAGVVAAVAAVWLLTTRLRPHLLNDRLALHLTTTIPESSTTDPALPHLLSTGLHWSQAELRVRRIAAVIGGSSTGGLLAQGDLFVMGPGRSIPVLMTLGGAGGWIVFSMWMTSRTQQRERQLRFELPSIADALALQVLAGSSVLSAVQSIAEGRGVAAAELQAALQTSGSDASLPDALRSLGDQSACREAGRLYSFLAEAHVTGGRIVDGLAMLARDYRGDNERRLVIEGGKRALAAYGPILALMVPVTLLFLMYPTIVGLRSLAGG